MMARIGMLRALKRGYIAQGHALGKAEAGARSMTRNIQIAEREKAGGRYTVGYSLRLPARVDVRFRRIPT